MIGLFEPGFFQHYLSSWTFCDPIGSADQTVGCSRLPGAVLHGSDSGTDPAAAAAGLRRSGELEYRL